ATAWTGAQQHLVVRGPARGGVTPEEIASASGVPLALAMRPERGMAAGAERGLTPGHKRRGALRRGAGTLIKKLDLASCPPWNRSARCADGCCNTPATEAVRLRIRPWQHGRSPVRYARHPGCAPTPSNCSW